MRAAAIVLMALAAPVSAQATLSADPRVLDVPAASGAIVHVKTAPDTTQTVLFRRGEQIVSVIVSDPTAYTIQVSGAGDSLSLRAARPSALAMMSVRTSAKTYEFELAAGGDSASPAVIRIAATPRRSAPQPQLSARVEGPRTDYDLSGSKALLPSAISDDGLKTYIEWAGDRPMPATFALGPTGKEQMVEGYMRGGVFTIDRVYKELIFRIDKQHAKAKRQERRAESGRADHGRGTNG